MVLMPKYLMKDAEQDCECKFKSGDRGIFVKYDSDKPGSFMLPICSKCKKPWKEVKDK